MTSAVVGLLGAARQGAEVGRVLRAARRAARAVSLEVVPAAMARLVSRSSSEWNDRDRHAAADAEHVDRGRTARCPAAQLVVDLDAQGLEGPLGGVSALALRGHGDRLAAAARRVAPSVVNGSTLRSRTIAEAILRAKRSSP